MRPTGPQLALLTFAAGVEYVRPGSPTHARLCGTTSGKLLATAKACSKKGWLKAASDGRYVVTAAGRTVAGVKQEPKQQDDDGDEDWAF